MSDALGGLTALVRAALSDGGRLVPRGSGQWWPGAPEGARALPTGPTDVDRVDAADHVATAGAGCTLAELDRTLAEHGTFLALDPPGTDSRTLGGALGAGGGGPLAAGFGPPRDQVLGLTFVSGTGTVVRTGGRVVKNVAGFDLAKAVVGSHGGFGVIASAHLRLRARPAADRTQAWSGSMEDLAAAAQRLLASGASPAAFEIVSPELALRLGLARTWTLLLRALGAHAGVAEELQAAALHLRARGVSRVGDVPDPWRAWRGAVGEWPVVLRVGADPASWTGAVPLVEGHAGHTHGVSATVPRGTVRIGLNALAAAGAAAIRLEAARRGWPVTLERAEASTRAAVGVWGSLPPGALELTQRLRRVFDPAGVFDVPLLGGRAEGREGAKTA